METLCMKDFAAILQITPGALRVRLSRRPESLPAPVLRGRGAKVIWMKSDIEGWLRRGGKASGDLK